MADVAIILTPVPVVAITFTPTAVYGPFQPFINVVESVPGTLIEDEFYIVMNP